VESKRDRFRYDEHAISMKWLFGIAIVLIVIIAGWFVWTNANGPAATPSTAPTATSTVAADILPGVPNETYTDQRLSFSIDYPATASTTADFSSGYLPVTQTPLLAIELPQSMFSGTNLTEAGVYIGATTTPTGITNCAIPSEENNETEATGTVVGGQQFSVFTSTGVGAGNIYQEKVFRTIQNGACLEIVELLHSGNIGNYPEGSVTQFDQAQFSGILDAIVQTYYPIPTGY
jgi:hypothetical protein